MSRSSYGHTYLTSYGWAGTGTALRNGAIAKPLAIPPKKTLSGVGKDRDDAFPFWDHLFAAASKAITIKVSNDDDGDDDETETPRSIDPGPAPLRRTATGILSNRRPIEGTPASTSGTTTPNLTPNAGGPGAGAARSPSLFATAKREAAKRSLYALFFRGPVLGPENDPPESISHSAPPSSESSSMATPVPEHVDDRGVDVIVGEIEGGKKRRAEDKAETKEGRRERKRLKRERKAAKAAKSAEKALAQAKETNDRRDRNARKHQNEDAQAEENQARRKARKRARKLLERSEGNDLEQEKHARKGSEDELPSISNRRHIKSLDNLDTANAYNPTLATKKRKRKRKHTQS